MRVFVALLAFLLLLPGAADAKMRAEKATASVIFAGGHFWAFQEAMDNVPGVLATVAGYIGGQKANPSYGEVVSGKTAHRMAVLVIFDPAVTNFEKLLQYYWHNIDPADAEGQFCNRGMQFTTAVYYTTPEQKNATLDSKMLMETDNSALADKQGNNVTITAQILPAGIFYAAEIGQQSYYRKNPLRYRFFERGCGRTTKLYDIWGGAWGSPKP